MLRVERLFASRTTSPAESSSRLSRRNDSVSRLPPERDARAYLGMLKEPQPYGDDEDELVGRYDALRAAALVCARWRDPAQRVLFAEVALNRSLFPDRW